MRVPLHALLAIPPLALAAPAGAVDPVDWTDPLAQVAAYPLQECVVCEADLALGATNNLHGDRLIRVSSNECWEAFVAGPRWFLQRIDAALLEQQGPGYPLTTCAVCGTGLGEGAVDHIRGSRVVRLCGEECVMRFLLDPKPAMAAVDAAWIESLRAGYPTNLCPVMEIDVEAMGTPTEILHGTRLVRLCCESCVEKFREDPAAWLARLDELAAGGGAAGAGGTGVGSAGQ